MSALRCNDWRAHCQTVYNEPQMCGSGNNMVIQVSIQETLKGEPPQVEVAPKRYLLPCRHLHFRPERYEGHPSTLHDLFQAEAVAQDYADCPLLHPEDLKEL